MSSPTKAMEATYERPVKARLQVVPEVGEPWDASPQDLLRFGFTQQSSAYARFERWLCEVLNLTDCTDAALNIIRYAVECAIMNYGHMPGGLFDDPAKDLRDRQLVRRIEAAAASVLEEGGEG